MQANELARKHFDAAMREAKALGLDPDAVARAAGACGDPISANAQCAGCAVGTAIRRRELRS